MHVIYEYKGYLKLYYSNKCSKPFLALNYIFKEIFRSINYTIGSKKFYNSGKNNNGGFDFCITYILFFLSVVFIFRDKLLKYRLKSKNKRKIHLCRKKVHTYYIFIER